MTQESRAISWHSGANFDGGRRRRWHRCCFSAWWDISAGAPHRGDHGLVAYAARQQLLAQAQDNLVRTQADRTEWERRVAELRSDHLDPDLLDERARAMLNLADPSDIIVPAGDKDRLY